MNKKIKILNLGTKDYLETWDYQEKLFQQILSIKSQNRRENLNQSTPNYLLFVDHPHVYTLGKRGNQQHLLIDKDQLKSIGATYYEINRGGDITYHGPGQLVGYPILDLENFFTDIHRYLRLLEESIICMLAEYGISAGRSKGETGVWLDVDTPWARKICALGIRTSRWVSMHGFALNVNTHLGYFDKIVPCGISDKSVTSMQVELGKEISLSEVQEKVQKHFLRLFEAEELVNDRKESLSERFSAL